MEKRKRKRFNRNAICSSYNYKESKKAHREFLKEEHSAFSIMAVAEMHKEEGELSLSRKMAIQQNRKISTKEITKTVWIKIAWTGKLVEVSLDMYNRSFSHARKYDCHGNEIFD
jgi:hypothetical protein